VVAGEKVDVIGKERVSSPVKPDKEVKTLEECEQAIPQSNTFRALTAAQACNSFSKCPALGNQPQEQ